MTYDFAPIREGLVETAEIPCRLCGSSRYREIFRADNIRRRAKRFFSLVECEDCGFRFFNPSPIEESLKYYYEDYMAHVPERINWVEKIYYQLFRNVRGLKPPGKLLDIGCGNGKYMDFMRSRGWEVTGVDTGPACDFPRSALKMTVHEGQLWDQKFPDSFFDVITLWFVIEHVWDLHRLMAECRRILKPGGQLILSTLNSASFEARLFKRYWWHLLAPEHLWQFDKRSLTALLEKNSLQVDYFRQEPVCCGILGSIQNILDAKRIPLNINSLVFKMLFVPLDLLCSLLGSSGLMTVYAKKEPFVNK
jgi:2-polyprenyl-3-methyl-5-hydroxy-6-metoxy-1,4-benzoquinol methylase